MDLIDHLIYTANNSVRTIPKLTSDFLGALPGAVTPNPATGNYPAAARQDFIFYQDTDVIERAIQKHWFDINGGPVSISGMDFFKPTDPPPYHLIFAYLLENTRLVQIMERLIHLYQHDELLGIAGPSNTNNQLAFQWIMNTENLFFKSLSNNSYRNISSSIRPSPEGTRRNAYQRLFGMDLAFGDAGDLSTTNFAYHKAKTANAQFIVVFEQFLSEIWQAYINVRNTSGANTTDYQRLVDLATKLRQMLLARRGVDATIECQQYRMMNLSKEEYSSVVMMTWMFYIISDNTSPLVQFLACQANTAAERLANIGRKVGIPSHKKSQGLFDMAASMATILRQIEFGTFESSGITLWIQGTIESQTPLGSAAATPEQSDALRDLLIVINNWEKTTGHPIKVREPNQNGAVRVAQLARGAALVSN